MTSDCELAVRADPRPVRAGGEVGVRDPFDRARHDHLTLDAQPPEHERAVRVGRRLVPLARPEVREEHEAPLVEVFEQHRAPRW